MRASVPAYVVIDATVTDPVRYAAYLKMGDPAMAAAGGRFLARGGAITHLEGPWQPSRMVIVEFPDRGSAVRWYNGELYRAAKAHRQGAAVFSANIVDGLPSAPAVR